MNPAECGADAHRSSGWYLNLQDPVRRYDGGFDTLDHELDYWIPAATWQVKDAELFEQRVAEERYTADQADASGPPVRRSSRCSPRATTGGTSPGPAGRRLGLGRPRRSRGWPTA